MGALGMNPFLYLVQFISNFIQFLGKYGQNNRLAQLPSEKYWNLMCAFYYKVSASVVFISTFLVGIMILMWKKHFALMQCLNLPFAGPIFSVVQIETITTIKRISRHLCGENEIA